MVVVYNNKYDELVSRAIDELRAKTDITQLTPGAKARALIEITMRELGTAYSIFSKDILQAFVKNAVGENLDFIGELLGITRRRETRNVIEGNTEIQKFYVENGTFGDINDASTITIPSGTKISTPVLDNEERVFYVLIEDCSCLAASSVAYASVEAISFGPTSNVGEGTLTLHEFEQYTDYLNDSLKTTNIEAIAYAIPAENDTNFRYRITNRTLESEAANSIAIRMAAFSVPGVADILLDEFHMGIGTGAVYIKAITPTVSDALLARVQDVLHLAKALGNLVEARAPKTVGVEITLKLNLYEDVEVTKQEILKQQVRDVIVNYINKLDINESLDLEDLIRFILRTDSNIKSLGTPTRQIDHVYVWRYSAAEDNRIRSEVLPGVNISTVTIERIIIEPTPPPSGGDRITVRI